MKLKPWIYYTIVILFAGFAGPASASDGTCANTKIVVLGDSLSAGYGLPPGAGFPEQLDLALDKDGYGVEIQNAGVSGDTTSGGLARLDWSVGEGVDLVIVELGANDALRGIPVEITRENLDQIIGRLKDKNVSVLLAGMLAPPNMGEAYGQEFSSVYTDLAAKHDVTLYPFFLEGVAADPSLNLEDGIHPNEDGIDVIVSNVMPVVVQELQGLCKG